RGRPRRSRASAPPRRPPGARESRRARARPRGGDCGAIRPSEELEESLHGRLLEAVLRESELELLVGEGEEIELGVASAGFERDREVGVPRGDGVDGSLMRAGEEAEARGARVRSE